MDKNMILSVTLIILLITSISGCIQPEETNGNNNDKILYVGTADSEYRTIQEAINAAVDGALIMIRNGSYNEKLTINKTISLRGENKNTTVIDFNPNSNITQVPIITINADNCSIENVHITLSKQSVIIDGIEINSNNNTIKNNIITGVTEGINLLTNALFNTISHNEIHNNLIGVFLMNSRENTISNNTIFSNTQYNMYLELTSHKNIISYNVMSNSSYGIRLKSSENNEVYKNCIKNNDVGVYCCCGAEMNRIYSNSLVNNSENARENQNLINEWYNYKTGIGNYWDDYNGSDMNKDEIGDTPYVVNSAGNADMYPLMSPPMDVACGQ